MSSTKLAAGNPESVRRGTGVASPTVRKPLVPPASWPPTLVVVIDTEEEFDWDGGYDPANAAVTNIRHQPLAQDVFDRHGVVPSYVVDYPVATSPEAVAILGEFAADGRCEIGAHLHPWVNPPTNGPVDACHSYPGNWPADKERQKLIALTEAITTGFGSAPTIYKAGRYGIGAATPQILRELGYRIDVSVVPCSDFTADGGPDFSGAPTTPFMMDEGLCELPLTVQFIGRLSGYGPALLRLSSAPAGRLLHLGGILSRLGLLERLRLTPEGYTLADMIRLTRGALANGTRLFMLTYHSSSLLPGGAPYVRTEAERSAFLATLDGYLAFFRSEIGGRMGTVTNVATALADNPVSLCPS